MAVNYAEVESMWMGETPKNVAAVFRGAEEKDAVLFFDEADAIAARRAAGITVRQERESNTTVNVLLRELETFNGVVIFATNLAANFDPAFERRIRTHVLFEMPGVEERERIWRVQLHPTRTPLADDVNFQSLAERYAVSGGDIKNAVLKAATAAASEDGRDDTKRIHQRHFERAIEEVIAGRTIMQQSLFQLDPPLVPNAASPFPEPSSPFELLRRETRAIALSAAALGGVALIASLIALGAALAR
jgi:SpoVK/Ycf46/Vps4 family AAA+-type ATPase